MKLWLTLFALTATCMTSAYAENGHRPETPSGLEHRPAMVDNDHRPATPPEWRIASP